MQDKSLTGLVCDLQQISYIDSAGIALLRNLERHCAKLGIRLHYQNLPEVAEHFLKFERRPSASLEEIQATKKTNRIARLGRRILEKLNSVHNLLQFLGEFIVVSFLLFRHPRQLRIRDFCYHIQKVGSEATFLVCTLNALTGIVVVFQGLSVARTFGAPIYVADMVTRSITGQMAPVLTAILVAGRSGTAFAANIGTMKLRQELDVLAVMNFNIISFLVIPRVFAITIATPILTILADAAGILGGLFTCTVFLDMSAENFINQVHSTLQANDIFTGIIKGLVFGLIIGLTGCFHGLNTENTADSVGLRTTWAVVSSIIIIILVNTLFAALFNKFGW